MYSTAPGFCYKTTAYHVVYSFFFKKNYYQHHPLRIQNLLDSINHQMVAVIHETFITKLYVTLAL